MTERTNDDWVRALGGTGADDEAAVAELREVLRRGLRRALTGRAAADDGFIEDMTQEGVLKVLSGLTTFRGDSRFTTWAVTVAVRVAFTELRRARWNDVSLDRLVEDAPARLPTAPPAEAPSQDARQAILAEMHRVLETGLTDRQRQALVAELRGMPQAEIAVSDDIVALVLRVLDPPAPADLELMAAFEREFSVRIYLQPGGPGTIAPLDPSRAPAPLSYRLPDHGISIDFDVKEPGSGLVIRPAKLNFDYNDYFQHKPSPEAYQRLLQDVVVGDQSLFIRSDEVEESWRWADSLRTAMQQTPVHTYAKNTWGPTAADNLFGECEGRWTTG